jgi:hypothetical protein
LSDGRHVLAIATDRFSALTADSSHVLAITTYGLAALSPNGAALFGRKIIPTASILFGLLLLAGRAGVGARGSRTFSGSAVGLVPHLFRVSRLRALRLLCVWHDRSFALGF